jgi:hypothetical protein
MANVNKGTEKDVQNTKSALNTILEEIHVMVFKKLNRAISTCLGLTKKCFYAIHREINRSVTLEAWYILPPNKRSGLHLYELLEEWMAPLVFCRPKMKFSTKAKLVELKNYYRKWKRAEAGYTRVYEIDSTAIERLIRGRIDAEVEIDWFFQGGRRVWVADGMAWQSVN